MEGLVVGGGCGVWGAQQGRAQRLGTEVGGQGGGDGCHWCCLSTRDGCVVFLVLVLQQDWIFFNCEGGQVVLKVLTLFAKTENLQRNKIDPSQLT